MTKCYTTNLVFMTYSELFPSFLVKPLIGHSNNQSNSRVTGDGCKKVQVGQLSTPIGTVHLSVSYRTDLTIQPQKIGTKDHSIMYKSDHFRPDGSPKNSRTHKS